MTVVETHSAAWHAERRTGIGGSEIGALVGLSPYASPFSVWAEKVGLTEPEESDDERLQTGRDAEPFLAAVFHRKTGLHVAGEQMMIRDPEHPHRRATIDGLVMEAGGLDLHDDLGTLDGALGNVQFKTWAGFGFKDDTPPAAMRAQTIWEMGVGGWSHAWLAVLFGSFRMKVWEYDMADPEVAADWSFMVARAEWFWNLVETQTPPPVDGSDATAQAIAAIWPDHRDGVTHDASPELAEILHRRRAIKDRILNDQKVVDQCDAEIAIAIGDAEQIAVDGVPRWSYRAQQRTTLDAKALSAAHPELVLEPFQKVTQFRVLREIKEKMK